MRNIIVLPFDNKGKLQKEAETNNKIQHTSSQATEVIPNQCQRLVTLMQSGKQHPHMFLSM